MHNQDNENCMMVPPYCHTVIRPATWLLYSGPNLRAYWLKHVLCRLVVLCHVHLLKGSVNLCVPPRQQGAQNFMTLGNKERDAGPLVSQARSNQPHCRPLCSEWYRKQSALGLVESDLQDYWSLCREAKCSTWNIMLDCAWPLLAKPGTSHLQ